MSEPRWRGRLESLRLDPGRRRPVTLLAALLGLFLGMLHPLGFLVGGALVALPQRSIPRGVVAGLAFGLFSLAAFGVSLALAGVLGTALGLGELVAVSAAVPVVAGLLGGLARGIV